MSKEWGRKEIQWEMSLKSWGVEKTEDLGIHPAEVVIPMCQGDVQRYLLHRCYKAGSEPVPINRNPGNGVTALHAESRTQLWR